MILHSWGSRMRGRPSLMRTGKLWAWVSVWGSNLEGASIWGHGFCTQPQCPPSLFASLRRGRCLDFLLVLLFSTLESSIFADASLCEMSLSSSIMLCFCKLAFSFMSKIWSKTLSCLPGVFISLGQESS